MPSRETPGRRMLPHGDVITIGGRSIIDNGKKPVYPRVDALVAALRNFKMVIGTGGGIRAAHVTAIGMDLGLPTGVLAQIRIIDALGNAHLLGTLLAPHGVVAMPPEILGHMLPFFIKAAPAVICNADPPFSLWEHPPRFGRVPPHRTDAGGFLLAQHYRSPPHRPFNDVPVVFDSDPTTNSNS